MGMKLTAEENPETIKRYGHIRPAPFWSSDRCGARCPGTDRTCTLRKGHRGHHVAHVLFRKVVAVWEGKGTAPRARAATGTASRPARSRAPQGGGVRSTLAFLRHVVSPKLPSVEEAAFVALFLLMIGFFIDWALRIAGIW